MSKIRAWWTTKPPRVLQGYATSPADVPCYAIVLASDRPEKTPIGYFAGSDPADPSSESIGSVESRTYSILVYGYGPDMALYLYKVLKQIILRRLLWLAQNGAQDPTYNGRELEPVPAYLPDRVYMRVFTLTIRCEEYYDQIVTPIPFVDTVDVRRLEAGGGVVVDPTLARI
jgi:hypothetical protein